MKSTINDFWKKVISSDEFEQEQGFMLWDGFIKENPYYNETLKIFLPTEFWSVYNNVNFHDFKVTDICYSINEEFKKLEITVYDYYRDNEEGLYYRINYENVINLSLNVSNSKYDLFWNNDILEIINEKHYRHRVLFTDGNNLDVTFKNIYIARMKQC